MTPEATPESSSGSAASARGTSAGAPEAPARAGTGALAPLRHGAYRWLVLARFTNYLGNAVAPIALAFAVLDLTGSVVDLGLVVGARSLANVALLLFGGVLADRLPRPLVLQGSSVVAAVTQAVVAASVLGGFASIPLLMVLSILNGAAGGTGIPAAAALTPQTVPAGELRQANAMLRVFTNAALIGGASAGGALVAVVGPGWGIAVDAATFALCAVFFARVRVPRVERATAVGSPLADLRDGWSEFAARPWVWVVVLQFMVVNAALTGGMLVLGPAIADETIGRQAWGLVLAAQTLGFIVGGLVAMRWQARRALRLGVILTAVEALPLLMLAVAPRLLVLVPVLFVAGLAMEQFGIAWDVSLQENIPPDRLARVYAYDALGSFLAIPVGEVLVGPIALAVGTDPTLIGAACLLVAATALALLSREVRSLERRTSPDAAPLVAAPLDLALADGALAERARSDRALADDALAEPPRPDPASADGASADPARPNPAPAEVALADGVLADPALPDPALLAHQPAAPSAAGPPAGA